MNEFADNGAAASNGIEVRALLLQEEGTGNISGLSSSMRR